MPEYTIEVHGESRELYSVEAGSMEEAVIIFESGRSLSPFLTEISGACIVSIEEAR
jgi:hypothetical protein